MWCLLVVSSLSFFGAAWGQALPENPCRTIFAYRQYRGIYYGEIEVPSDGSKNLNLAVNISMVGLYQDVKLKLELLTPTEQILTSPVFRYRVNFPLQDVIPRITQIAFNGRIYCYGASEPVTTKGVTNLWANIVYRINEYTYRVQSGLIEPSDGSSQNAIPSTNSFLGTPRPPPVDPIGTTSISPPVESCGVANDLQPLVLGGETTIENEYPWLVALFRRDGPSYNIQCTSNLITNRHVITAAHCVWFYKVPLIQKEDLLLVLGRSNISRWVSSGAIVRTALEVVPHPNYRQDSGHCDIAIIKMNEEVVFKPTIKPICLWDGDDTLKPIVGSQGLVAGWGKPDESRSVAAETRKIAMPVVSQEACLRSNTGFKSLTSEMTFCAGNRDGSGPCTGDSGAGFMVRRNGRWFLRGVVSNAIKKDLTCDLDEYVVFADVAKLMGWVQTTIN